MGYAWIDEAQQYIDEYGVVSFLEDLGVSDVWTSYESCLCQINLDGVQDDEDVFATIVAQGMLSNVGYQAFLVANDGGNLSVLDLSDGIVSIEDDVLSISFTADPYVVNLLYTACAFLLTSDSPSEITALQVVRIDPAAAVLTFDMPAPSQPLPAPTGVNVVNNAIVATQARSTVSWNAVANATGYKVEYKRDADTTWTSQTVSATSLQISTLTRNTLYNFRVTALGDGTTYTDSPASSVVSITTKARLAQPANFRATAITQTSITMSWDAVANSNGYRTRIKPAAGSTWTNIDTKNTTATFTGLTKGTTYDVSIRTTANTSTNYDSSAFMNPIEVTTLNTTRLATPTGLNATNVTSNSARVSWTAVENASGYKVEYRQAAGGGQTYPWIEASD